MKKIGVLVIVFSVLFTMTIAPIFAVTGSDGSVSSNVTLYSDSTGTLTWQTQVTAMKPYLTDIDYDPYYRYSLNNSALNSSIQSQIQVSICQDYLILVRLANNTNSDLFVNLGYGSLTFTTSNSTSNPNFYSTTVKDIHGSLSNYITSVSTSGNIQFRWDDRFTYNSGLVIPSKSVLYCMITYSVYYYFTNSSQYLADLSAYSRPPASITLSNPKSTDISTISNFTLMNADYNSIEELDLLDNIYDEIVLLYQRNHTDLNNLYTRNHTDLQQIHTDLQAILDAYTTNASNVTETQDNIDTVTTNEQQLHTAEQNFYQQNEQALQNVGISNFSFSSDQSSGLGSVITDFTTLWNNIGPLQIIFTFTLSMSLATFLLRHKPVTGAIKKSQQK